MQPLRIAGDFDAEYNWLDPALNHSRLQQSLFIEILAQQLLVTWTQLFPFKLVLARTELLEQLSLVEVALLQRLLSVPTPALARRAPPCLHPDPGAALGAARRGARTRPADRVDRAAEATARRVHVRAPVRAHARGRLPEDRAP